MSDFASKLNKLQVVEGPERIDLTTLHSTDGYDIIAARFHHHQQFGSSIIVTLMVNSEERIAFLPKRFARTLCQSEVDLLASGGFKLRCTGVVNKSPVVEIFKS